MMESARHSKFTTAELEQMAELGERLCSIVDESDGRITFAEIARQCSVNGGKLSTYSRARRYTRSVYKRAAEWLRQFEEKCPDAIIAKPAVQLDPRALGLDSGLSVEMHTGGDCYDQIASFERESIY